MINIQNGEIIFDDGFEFWPWMDYCTIVHKKVLSAHRKLPKRSECERSFLLDGILLDARLQFKEHELYKVRLRSELGIDMLHKCIDPYVGEYEWGKIYFSETFLNEAVVKYYNQNSFDNIDE